MEYHIFFPLSSDKCSSNTLPLYTTKALCMLGCGTTYLFLKSSPTETCRFLYLRGPYTYTHQKGGVYFKKHPHSLLFFLGFCLIVQRNGGYSLLFLLLTSHNVWRLCVSFVFTWLNQPLIPLFLFSLPVSCCQKQKERPLSTRIPYIMRFISPLYTRFKGTHAPRNQFFLPTQKKMVSQRTYNIHQRSFHPFIFVFYCFFPRNKQQPKHPFYPQQEQTNKLPCFLIWKRLFSCVGFFFLHSDGCISQ